MLSSTARRFGVLIGLLSLAGAGLMAVPSVRAGDGGGAAPVLVARPQGHITVPQVPAGTLPGGITPRTAAAGRPQPHVPRPAALAGAKALPGQSSRVPVHAGPAGPAGLLAPAPPLVGGFAGATRAGDIAAFPGNQDATPPDATLAVSSTSVAEVVNSSLWVTGRGGNPISHSDLTALFGWPDVGDPRILYDAGTNTWFMSVLSQQFAGTRFAGSIVYVAVAANQSVPAQWSVVAVQNTPGVLQDQPKLGYSDDKVIVSFSDFDAAGHFGGQETWALQKSELIAGTAVWMTSLFGRDTRRFALAPAQALSGTSDAWAVYNNADPALTQNSAGPSLGVVRIVGTPHSGLAVYETDPQLAAMSAPPSAPQRNGSYVDTGDDRLLGAVWLNGLLWTTANVACSIGGGPAHACSRFIEAQADAGGTTIIPGQVWDLGAAGADYYYAAATFTGAGDMIASVTESTGSLSSAPADPSVVALGQAHGYEGGPSFVNLTQAGTTYYQDGSGTFPCNSPCSRWGDYGGAAYDPADARGAWVVGEYVPVQPGPSVHSDWGTWLEDVSAAGVPAPGGGYTLDGYGGVHPMGDSPPVTTNGSWPGWNIARALEVNPCDPSGQSGWVLEGLGGLHPFNVAGRPMPSGVVSFYTGGWDIARDFTATCVNNHPQGCVLDGWGGLHPWADSSANWPACVGTAYYQGWDITRKLSTVPGTTCGFVLDGFGGLHSFNNAQLPSPAAAYWGWDIAADIVATGNSCSNPGGYTLDGWGGIHAFGTAVSHPLAGTAYWPGWSIARGLTLAAPGHPGGYVLDGWDGVHAAGAATPLATTAYTPGLSIARDIISAP